MLKKPKSWLSFEKHPHCIWQIKCNNVQIYFNSIQKLPKLRIKFYDKTFDQFGSEKIDFYYFKISNDINILFF